MKNDHKPTNQLKLIGLVSLTLIGGLFFDGCAKYEEGPKTSLRTKKGRLTGTWNIARQETIVDDQLQTDFSKEFFEGITWEFNKEDEWFQRDNDSIFDQGKWTFEGDVNLHINSIFTGKEASWEILKLKHKEMRIRLESFVLVLNEPHPAIITTDLTLAPN